MLPSKIQISEYDLLCCDRKRHRRGVACHIKIDLSYNVKSYFINIESIFFELLLPTTKQIVVGSIVSPAKPNKFYKDF